MTTRFVFLDNCWRLPPLTVVFALLLIIEMFSIRLSEAKENRNVFLLVVNELVLLATPIGGQSGPL